LGLFIIFDTSSSLKLDRVTGGSSECENLSFPNSGDGLGDADGGSKRFLKACGAELDVEWLWYRRIEPCEDFAAASSLPFVGFTVTSDSVLPSDSLGTGAEVDKLLPRLSRRSNPRSASMMGFALLEREPFDSVKAMNFCLK
jgi:hypothetical protein